MSLPLINFISIALTAVSLVVFFAALRRANRLTTMSRSMAHQVASSAANLQQALAILQAERETCRDESVRLEARLEGFGSCAFRNHPRHRPRRTCQK